MEETATGTAWDEPDQVRRTLMLPAEIERALADAAHARGIRPNDLLRELIVQGLARLSSTASPAAGPGP